MYRMDKMNLERKNKGHRREDQMRIEHVESTERERWQYREVSQYSAEDEDDFLELTGIRKQKVRGFGGCFNELGWEAAEKLPDPLREEFFEELFSEIGCGFTLGRVPVGANDFSKEWYSCDDREDDFSMEAFQIDRDRKYTLPYIRAAMEYQKDLSLFASPWSPPVWMKTKKAYNYGRMKMEKEYLSAYADYLIRFADSYRKEGIRVDQIHVQNEPMADQKFPSCLWSGEDMLVFIRDYLGPVVQKYGQGLELWLGTINGPFVDFQFGSVSAPFAEFYDQFENTILSDRKARSFLTGVGFQWGGKHAIAETILSYPKLRYMQTESECGDGKNTWEHAEYVYRLMWHYFQNQVESYLYWNMILPEGGISTWGWSQNSLFTVDEDNKLIRQPELYMMKHLSHYVQNGAAVLQTRGIWASNCIVFENPDESLVIVAGSNMNRDRMFHFHDGERSFSARISAHSIHTFFIRK